MAENFKPKNEEQLKEAILYAGEKKLPLNINAGESKKNISQKTTAENQLQLSNINGIIQYEAEEMILSLRPATPLDEVNELLKKNQQQLPFEPPDFKNLTQTNQKPTVGGVVAAGFAGSRRPYAGSVRDHFLGFRAISGRGEEFKAGGKVIKNVTGYDVPKILAASWGTLAVMSEITLKTLPIAEDSKTIALKFDNEKIALNAMIAAMQIPCDVTSAAHIPHDIARKSPLYVLSNNAQNNQATTLVRVEGVDTNIQIQLIQKKWAQENIYPIDTDIMECEESEILWKDIGSGAYFDATQNNVIWRLAVVPYESVKIAQKLRKINAEKITYDWAGGLIWCVINAENTDIYPQGKAQEIYQILSQHGGGSAILMRAPENIRHNVHILLDEPLYKLTNRFKNGFDPNGILNPGRMKIKPYKKIQKEKQL